MSTTAVELPELLRQDIDRWLEKFPPEERRSGVLYALRRANEHFGWLSVPVMDAVAAHIDVPNIAVYEVATFYTMYDRAPVGKYKIGICRSISCFLCGADQFSAYVQKKLGIAFGETTPDGRFTLEAVECLAACAGAPAMIINNKEYHEKVTPQMFDQLIEGLE